MLLFYGFLVLLVLYAIFATLNALIQYTPTAIEDKYEPRTLVIVPCRGTDLTSEQNLKSLKNQDYKKYDIIGVVDNEFDEAVNYLTMAGIKYITTNQDFSQGSGKVNAIATALDRFRGYDAYVIADSDICAAQDWLSRLVAPLAYNRTGISTTFPYFKPEGSFWSKVKSVWGFVGQGMMESELLAFGWGGSLAFKKELLDENAFELFKKSVSDDVALTKIAKWKGLKVFYVPEAQPVVHSADDFRSFLEWSNRQTALSIHGNPKVFWLGLVSYGMSLVLFLSALILGFSYSSYAFLLLIPFALGTIKSIRRAKELYPEILPINIMLPAVFIFNLLAAKNMRSISWRGREYSLQQE